MKKDFLAITDYSSDELVALIDSAYIMKKEFFNGGNKQILKNKVLAMVFNKPSLRTRISFDMAMRHLGGDALFISPAEIGLGKRESIADVARVLSGYVSGIMARVFEHSHILELAKWSSIPVINGLSDYNHPCQALADAFTIYEHFGSFENIKVTYIGDGNNVAISLMIICLKLGMDFNIASPEGYRIDEKSMKIGEKLASEKDLSLMVFNDPKLAVKKSDVVYTDTWTSMGQEEEAAKRKKVFPPYQVNEKLLHLAKDSTVVMHCLPAHRGYEITDEVADGPRSLLFPQAHNRLHAQKAILVKLLT